MVKLVYKSYGQGRIKKKKKRRPPLRTVFHIQTTPCFLMQGRGTVRGRFQGRNRRWRRGNSTKVLLFLFDIKCFILWCFHVNNLSCSLLLVWKNILECAYCAVSLLRGECKRKKETKKLDCCHGDITVCINVFCKVHYWCQISVTMPQHFQRYSWFCDFCLHWDH